MADNRYNNDEPTPMRRAGKNHFVTNPSNMNKPQKTNNPEIDSESEWHPVAWIVSLVILIIACLILLFGFLEYSKAKSTIENTFVGDNNSSKVSNKLKQGKPFSILLMGTDTGAMGRHDQGRTDSMILATVNPKKKTTYFVSIPRDTKVVVPGDSKPFEKINAAYTIGGAASAKEVVSKLLNTPVDFYAVINMKGIKQMVNAVDGIDITPNLSFKYEGIKVKKGKTVHMNGFTALQYSRMRHQDPLGDYGRQIRQRQVLEAVMKKGLKISSATHFSSILETISKNLRTNLSFNDMLTLISQYRGATKNINEDAIQEDNADVDGVSFQVAPNKELLKVTNHIRKSLGLPTSEHLTPQQRKINSNKQADANDSLFDLKDSVTKNSEFIKH